MYGMYGMYLVGCLNEIEFELKPLLTFKAEIKGSLSIC